MPPCQSGAVACWLISHGYSTRESDPAARPYQDRQINRIVVLCDSCAARESNAATWLIRSSCPPGRRARYGARGSNSSLQGVGLLPSPDGEPRVGSGPATRTLLFQVQSLAILANRRSRSGDTWTRTTAAGLMRTASRLALSPKRGAELNRLSPAYETGGLPVAHTRSAPAWNRTKRAAFGGPRSSIDKSKSRPRMELNHRKLAS